MIMIMLKKCMEQVVYIQNKIEAFTHEYSLYISEGKQLIDSKQYNLALLKFEKAHELFPDEAYATDKIASVKKILNVNKTKSEIYNELIAKAENQFENEEYEKAINIFDEALHEFPYQKYPAQRIKAIKELIESLRDKEEAYRLAITKADKAFLSEIPGG